jgi:ubiquinone/menaquinone biosynthesis C-methylase UbiE
MLHLLKKWKKEHKLKQKYCASARLPFFDLSLKYLPHQEDSLIVDIGAGDGLFADNLKIKKKKKYKVFLLDSNKESINNLRKKHNNALLYKAPDKLPFKDGSISFVHISHLIEHLYPEEFYIFLKELDRVLNKNGILVISAPIFWQRFYDDLSHIKPYNPEVLIKYLVNKKKNYSNKEISSSYKIIDFVYRYRSIPLVEELYAKIFLIDIFLKLFRIVLTKLGFRRYIKNGYTIILQKSKK